MFTMPSTIKYLPFIFYPWLYLWLGRLIWHLTGICWPFLSNEEVTFDSTFFCLPPWCPWCCSWCWVGYHTFIDRSLQMRWACTHYIACRCPIMLECCFSCLTK